MTMSSIGNGLPVGVTESFTGVSRFVGDIEAVLRLAQANNSNNILIVPNASATGVAPVIAEVKGIICMSGGVTSHLALVCREFGVPCVMRAQLNIEPSILEGQEIRIDPDGSICLL